MDIQKCKLYRWTEKPLLCASMLDHLLFVPVVDLMNVSEHDLVFALHVIWNPLLVYLAHVALQKDIKSPRTLLPRRQFHGRQTCGGTI